MNQEEENSLVERIAFNTVDPQYVYKGTPLPALTSMLYKVCLQDDVMFMEASRLITLFIKQALKEKSNAQI